MVPSARSASVTWDERVPRYDDLLDAYAAPWSAFRFADGPSNYSDLDNGERDDEQLLPRIVI